MSVRIGLLGSGFVSNFYLLGLQDVPGWTIPVVASPNAEHAREFAKKWNIPESNSDMYGVIERPDIDLVVLGVPNFEHRDLAIRCAWAGKHVVCTKPLARTKAEAKEMLDAVKTAGVLHGYAETEVFSPSVMRAKKYIEQGGIGKVLTVRSREAHSGPHGDWFWKKELSGGGALLDMGCHTIEAARYFIGKENRVVEVMAWTDRLVHKERTDAEDNAVLLLRFEGGQLAQAELSWTAAGGLDLRNEVYGTEGTIFTDVTRETSLKVFSKAGAGYTVEKSQSDTGWLFPPVDEAWVYGYREEMRHFIECVAEGRMPRENFEDGFIVNCIIEAAYKSAQSKKWEPVDYS
ncbi:Gfo/Idh/MocA family oxidoreductase [Telmatocola sphagniphila]|uniref:Gfo/Idh/MocA family oxidoreductase n=1 Tax=Telmatocola sphagniphila TaxID=1123043 RepID=A0A8E6EUX4_9BACT|nr:Gfo/Idh/MocA family oxidoreductase [Telmatocola sphagniphila]QVL34204.1 Gfo/Idh/MocA family oxidoreductase [Telmatocola sphagniphila]